MFYVTVTELQFEGGMLVSASWVYHSEGEEYERVEIVVLKLSGKNKRLARKINLVVAAEQLDYD